MKLHEVLKLEDVLSGETWFRPVESAGVCYAYKIKDGSCYMVPSGRGGERGITANAELLAGDWEAVTPEQAIGDSNGQS